MSHLVPKISLLNCGGTAGGIRQFIPFSKVIRLKVNIIKSHEISNSSSTVSLSSKLAMKSWELRRYMYMYYQYYSPFVSDFTMKVKVW